MAFRGVSAVTAVYRWCFPYLDMFVVALYSSVEGVT